MPLTQKIIARLEQFYRYMVYKTSVDEKIVFCVGGVLGAGGSTTETSGLSNYLLSVLSSLWTFFIVGFIIFGLYKWCKSFFLRL